jgi:WD40 repeat protein
MIKRWALIVVLWLGVFVSPSHAQEPSNPYIYYFSDALNAFVIERADGTDTHVLGDGLMALTGEAHDIHVAGPGWSPSGRWFAWTAAQVSSSGWGWSGYRPYVLSADGTQRLTLLDHLDDAQLAWSADEDVLFVASRQTERLNQDDPQDHHSVIDTYLAVIDVADGKTIGLYEDQIFSDYYLYRQPDLRPDLTQTNDGEHFIASTIDFEGGASYDGTMLVVTMDSNGTITEKRLDAYGPVSIEGNYSDFPSVSPAGWLAYPTENSFQVENLLSGEQYTLPPLAKPESTYSDNRTILWDPSGQYALITDGGLWLLDCTTGILSQIRANWEFDSNSFRGERAIWSPAGTYAILLGADSSFFSFNRKSGNLNELPIEVGAGNYPDVAWFWVDEQHPLFYYAYQNAADGLFLYDLVSFSVQHIDIEFLAYTYPRLSSDGRYVAFVADGAVLYDRAAGSYQRFRPDYRGFNSAGGQEIAWDDTDQWLFVFDDALVAGGANIRYLDIVRADGAVQRDLSFSWTPNLITLNWLPPQVDVDALPPPITAPLIPQPETTLAGSQWSFYVDWSPDGRWLAAVLGWDSAGDITVWDIATGEIVHVFEDAEKDERVVWPSGDQFVPELSIPEHVPVWRIAHILARSPDGRLEVKDADQGTVIVDADTGDVIVQLNNTNRYEWESPYTAAAFSPDGQWLAATTPYGPIRMWRTDTFERLSIPTIPGQAVAFSLDGTQLAVTASRDVQIWNVTELLDLDNP